MKITPLVNGYVEREPDNTQNIHLSALGHSLDNLAAKVEVLTSRIDDFMKFNRDAVPIRVVYMIFALVFALLFGVEKIGFLLGKVAHLGG